MRVRRPNERPVRERHNHTSTRASVAEAPHQGQEASYPGLIQLLPEAVWICDENGHITYCNQYWRELSGMTAGETAELGWDSIVHPEDRASAHAAWQGSITDHLPARGEYRLRRARDGEYRWHLTQYFSMKDARADAVQHVGMAVDIHDQKTNQLELKDKDEHLQVAVEAARLGTWEYSIDTRRFSSSYRARALFGSPPDVEITETEFMGRIHPDDRRVVREAYARASAPQGLSEFEINYRIIRPDGAARWITARGKGVFSGAGSERKAVRLIGTAQDITSKKVAEQALVASEEKFRTAFNSNPDAMTITTLAEGVYLDVNDAFLRVTGFAREEVLGRRSLDVGIWIEAEDRARAVKRLTDNGRLESMETSFRTKNGEIVFMHFSAELIMVGNVQCVLATSQDMTERRRVTEELRRSEEQYRSLIEMAPYGVCRISAEGRFVLVNPTLVRMLGYERASELLELDVATQVYEDSKERERVLALLLRELSSKTRPEVRWKRKDGTVITVRLAAGRPILDSSGALLHTEVFVEPLNPR